MKKRQKIRTIPRKASVTEINSPLVNLPFFSPSQFLVPDCFLRVAIAKNRFPTRA